jgi:hypothetical protein
LSLRPIYSASNVLYSSVRLLVSPTDACMNYPISCGGNLSSLPVMVSLGDKNALTPPFLTRELIRIIVLYTTLIRKRLGNLLYLRVRIIARRQRTRSLTGFLLWRQYWCHFWWSFFYGGISPSKSDLVRSLVPPL